LEEIAYMDSDLLPPVVVLFADLGIYHRQGEFSFLRFQGRVDVAVDVEKMKISCEEGILEVRFPRKNRHELKSE
jgi:HSP20 family molecular chaperone IbpA